MYAVFYAFCMYKNGSGITFPFFAAGSLLFLCLSLSKLEITLKKGSAFYMAAIIALGVSTFCTDDARIIFFNKLGVFLLTMSLLLKQFYDTSKWKLGKYLGSICRLTFACMEEIPRPIRDGSWYQKEKGGRVDKRVWQALLGLGARPGRKVSGRARRLQTAWKKGRLTAILLTWAASVRTPPRRWCLT